MIDDRCHKIDDGESKQSNMTTPSLCSLLSYLIALLLLPLKAASMTLDGQYVLVEVYSQNKVAVLLPTTQQFRLHIDTRRDASNQYDVSINIGNSMSSRMTVLEETPNRKDEMKVSFAPVISTRMMPPPALFRIEQALNSILPDASVISLTSGTMKIEGSKGGLVLQAA
jgi:hypothetical protein